MKNKLKLFSRRLLLDNYFVTQKKKKFLTAACGFFFSEGLSAALRLDLFTLLDTNGPMRRSEIAKALNIPEKSARNLLSLLVSVDFVKLKFWSNPDDPTYGNTFLGKHYLSKKSPLEISGIIIGWFHFISYKAMYHYHDAIKAGTNVGLQELAGTEPTIYQRLAHQPELERWFQLAMHQLSNLTNEWLAEYIDFSSSHHVLDIGGGDGSNVIQIVKRNPHLKGTVFDSPTVSERANKLIANENLTDKVSIHPGNCFTDPFPKGPDVIQFCHFLDIWSEEQNRFLLQQAYDTLPPGGRVIILDIMEKDNGIGPHSAVITSAYFLTQATGNGYMYAAREYERWLKEIGFSKIKRQSFPDEHIAIVAQK